MARKLTYRFPLSLFEDVEEEGGWLHEFSDPSGLAVSEDDQNIYVDAAVPGLKVEEIEMTYDKGILWIKGEKREETEKSKKYYRKSINTFTYRLAVPGNIDEHRPPEASLKHGILHVTFPKTKKSEPKRIPINGG